MIANGPEPTLATRSTRRSAARDSGNSCILQHFHAGSSVCGSSRPPRRLQTKSTRNRKASGGSAEEAHVGVIAVNDRFRGIITPTYSQQVFRFHPKASWPQGNRISKVYQERTQEIVVPSSAFKFDTV
jgi:hypothetical protein